MYPRIAGISLTILTALWSISVLSGCQENVVEPPILPDPQGSIASCTGCHTNYPALKALATPDTVSAGGGCGGETPHLEPYDRVFMGGEGYQAYLASSHGKQACTECHGGVANTADKALAHSGNFIRHPSEHADTTCGACHASHVQGFANSLHRNGWGQKRMVYLRAGYGSFSQMPADLQAGYETNCAKCHAGCGDCHVNRPKAGGGGLLKGHQFSRVPDMRDNCVACHSSRGGHAYFGIGVGTVPDVHLSRLGDGHCMNCHNGLELHGTGIAYDQRYSVSKKPSCTMCHSSAATSNSYHVAHITTFNCQTCHSQDYNNCGSCHIGGEGARIPSYQGFKIGRNPLPLVKPFKYATLRQSLSAPDSWKEYGTADLANFAVQPTYKYTTPHNIQRWTKRTQVAAGKSCYDNCHIFIEGATLRNKELYLFQSDLQPWEVTADTGIVVDGHLPPSWQVP